MILLLLVMLAVVALNITYVALDNSPQHWDPANHVMHSMSIAKMIGSGQVGQVFNAWIHDYVFYPPGFYMLTAPAFLISGYSIDAGILWQLIYLCLTLTGIYFILRRISSSGAGLLGAFLYACFPIVLGFSRMTYIENLLALEVVAVILLVLEAKPFERLSGGVALGLAIGLGQMTKWQFGFYVAPLLAIVLAHHVIALQKAGAGRTEWIRLAKVFGAFCLAATLIAGPWYLSNLPRMISDLRYHAFTKGVGDLHLSSVQAVIYSIQAFPAQMIGIPMSIAVFVSIGCSFSKWKSWKLPALALSFAIAVLLLAVFRAHGGRFQLPLLPFAAILVAWNVARIRRSFVRYACIVFLVAVSAVNCIAQTFGSVGLLREVYLPIGNGCRGYVVRFGTPEWIMMPIRSQDWGLDAIFKQIISTSRAEKIEPTVAWCLMGDHYYYNANTLYSYVYAYGRKANQHKRANFWVCRLARNKFCKDGDVQEGRRLYTIGSWQLPDGSEARLYRCRPDIHPVTVPLLLNYSDSDHYFPGFYDADPGVRWSKGTEAAISLPVTVLTSQATSFQVILTMSGLGEQAVTAAFNDRNAGEFLVRAEPAAYSFFINRDNIRTNEPNVIMLHIPGAHAPNEVDTRILGVALQELEIKAIEAGGAIDQNQPAG